MPASMKSPASPININNLNRSATCDETKCKKIRQFLALHMARIKWLTRCALLALLACTATVSAQKLPLDKIKLPPGFSIGVFADNVPNARAMALGDQGTLFVGSMRAGKVYAIKVRDNKAIETLTIASGLDMPVGVAFRNGALYVSDVSRILRYDQIEANLATPPRPVVVSAAFPSETHHGWKFIAF